MKPVIHPFCSGETVAGRVVGLYRRYAAVHVWGLELPLEVAFIDWNRLRTADEALSLGDRVEAVVYLEPVPNAFHRSHRLWPRQVWHGAWLSRLPLLANPWPALQARYVDGSVVEVEMVDYIDRKTARVRIPGGLVIGLSTRDIHRDNGRAGGCMRSMRPGERFKVVIRRTCGPGGWVQRFSGATPDCLAEAGYRAGPVAERRVAGIKTAVA
jgi:hypothetical protein